ncbi:MAG: helix-turn-helix domain-containing protein [Pseudomonadota bacterium]|nr:helix-turn-helix domain-containing protein [Pseudomonadota bacterium]
MARVSGKEDPQNVLQQLGSAIRTLRADVGLSQEALADAAGIDRSHMGKIERGERNVTLLNLHRIALALRTKVSALLSAAGL